MPAYNHSAFKAENADKLGNFFKYLVIWNLVHYPAGVVPVTHVVESEEAPEEWERKEVSEDKKGSSGMPIGV